LAELDTVGHDLPATPDRLHTLNEIGRVLSSTLDLLSLFETIYDQVSRVMDTTLFFIGLVQPERHVISLPYFREEGTLHTDQEVPLGNSVTSLVIERNLRLLFNTDAEYLEFAEANGLPEILIGDEENLPSLSQIFVPLNTDNRSIGALSVQSTRTHAYQPEDMQTLSVIASQAAVAIANASLFAQTQTNLDQMRAMLDVAQKINGSLELSTVLDELLSGMRPVLPYYLATVLLPNIDEACLEIVGTIGPDVENWRSTVKIPFGQGVTGQVYLTGEPLRVGDVQSFPGYVGADDSVRSEMAVPLRQRDRIVGVLNVERAEVNAFSSSELDLLMLFASQAAIAIENARLFTEQRNRVYDLQTIQSIVQKLTPLHDIPSIAELVNRELKQLIDYHACRLFFLDESHKLLVPLTESGTPIGDLRLRVGEGVAGWIAQSGESVVIPNTLQDSRAAQIAGTPVRKESMIGAPLVYEGKVRGVITLSKLGINQFDENSLRLLEIISAQTAIAFDRARLYDELRTEAITDPLTKLYNRRYLLERFKEEKSRAIRNNHTLAAIMLDIDTFKRVNDRYGHDAGDVVLQEMALVIRAAVRAEDIVARYGGEEFCILLPEIPVDEAERVAERLRAMIQRRVLPETAGVRNVTVSVGMALLRRDDLGGELFSRADHAMYAVKHVGGNRVCIPDGNAYRFYGEPPTDADDRADPQIVG
jgi:diguanylate cyclase (GGDEF)-like protein